jgi:hypothetical protein
MLVWYVSQDNFVVLFFPLVLCSKLDEARGVGCLPSLKSGCYVVK